jgi:hypothetical protein
VSYTVDIWTQTFPANDAAAWDEREALMAQRDEAFNPDDPFEAPSPEMAELHRRLTARFPCICEDENGPWSDGPLINNFGRSHAILGICFSRVEEVLPFLVETATGMGMHVFDAQDDVIHRPVGYVPVSSTVDVAAEPRKWWQFWR